MSYKTKTFTASTADDAWILYDEWFATVTVQVISKSMLKTDTDFVLKIFYWEAP